MSEFTSANVASAAARSAANYDLSAGIPDMPFCFITNLRNKGFTMKIMIYATIRLNISDLMNDGRKGIFEPCAVACLYAMNTIENVRMGV